jgi:hypothetical protein
MRVGHLERDVDCSGVSGTGRVAELVRFSDGSVAIHWMSEHPCTTVYNNLEDLIYVHGHGGATRVVWDVQEIEPNAKESVEAH